MKVKELIEILKKYNPENYVGRQSVGYDTCDWYTFDDDEIVVMENSEMVEFEEVESKKLKQ